MGTLPSSAPRCAGEFLQEQKDQVSWDKNIAVTLKECLLPHRLFGVGFGILFHEGVETSALENSSVSLLSLPFDMVTSDYFCC